MKTLLHKHTISFRHALEGLQWALQTQPNYRIHAIISILIIIAGLIFDISHIEWLIIIMTITMGLVVETLNTGLESATDAITKEWRQEIKIAKDVAAAAMLTFAIGATTIAALVFLPKILMLFT